MNIFHAAILLALLFDLYGNVKLLTIHDCDKINNIFSIKSLALCFASAKVSKC